MASVTRPDIPDPGATLTTRPGRPRGGASTTPAGPHTGSSPPDPSRTPSPLEGSSRPAPGSGELEPLLTRWWGGSLRLRVIATTVLLGLLLSGLLGSVLYQQIALGLVDQAVDSAQRDAVQQVALAQEAFDSTDRRDDAGLNDVAGNQVRSMAGPSLEDGRQVVFLPALGNDRGDVVNQITVGVDADEIPSDLQAAIREDPENQQVVVVPVSLNGSDEPVTSVAVGSRMILPRAGQYDLVLVYPMVREQETLDLVRQLFIAAGVALTGLVAFLGWLATRMVTRPVARAAAVSQQLAQGRLDERLPVHGTDELAQLATSFNTMADSIQLQIRELRSLSQLQQRFVSDVSHELRTPLTTIRMAGEVLHSSREDFPEHLARSAELLQQELDRFEDLLGELLEISRFDSGAVTLERHEEDLVAVVRAAVDAVQTLAERLGSPVRLRVLGQDRNGAIPVVMDGRRIARVLRNLLNNALEHGEGEPLTVTVSARSQVAAVTVRDRGIGLDEEQLARVFDRFWRADPSRQRTTGGTGLGLAIAQEDARVHGGWLQVSSRPGAGAAFRLTLPRQDTYVIAEQPPPVPVATTLDGPPPEDLAPPVVLALASREDHA